MQPGDTAALAAAGLRGATLDLSDKVGALAEGTLRSPGSWTERGLEAIAPKGSPFSKPYPADSTFSQRYHAGLDRARTASDDFAERSPWGARVAYGLGSLAPTTQLAKAGPILGNAIAGTLEGFAQAPDTSVGGDLVSTGLGTLIGTGVGAGAKALPYVSQLAARLARGGLPEGKARQIAQDAYDAARAAGTTPTVPKPSLAGTAAKAVIPAAKMIGAKLIPAIAGHTIAGPLGALVGMGGEQLVESLGGLHSGRELAKVLSQYAVDKAAVQLAEERAARYARGALGRFIPKPPPTGP
jgi:hypothetical protein